MKNQKILFLKPPNTNITSATAPPIGLLYLASYLKKIFNNYYQMKLIDMRVSCVNTVEKLTRVSKKYNPDVVGISCCSEDDYYLHKITNEIKKINRNIFVVVGGPHPTMYYEDVLKDDNIDVAVIGEGEETFCELMNNKAQNINIYNIDGIAYKKDGNIKINPPRKFIEDLSSLPFPLWDLLEIDKYSSPTTISMNAILAGYKYMGIVTSRGCVYKCVYCHNIFGKQFRKRSAENVLDEIKILTTQYGIDEIHIYDDIFNLDKKRVEEICDLVLESGLKIKIAFPNGLRGDILDKSLLLKLKKSGAYMVTFALETASVRLQKLIKKYINIEKLKQNFIFANKIGLLTKCYTMLGFPTETLDEIKQTIKFTCALPITFASFFIVTPQKRTELFDLVTKFTPNYFVDFDANQYYRKHNDYEKAVKLPLKKLQMKAYIKFYFSLKRILRILLKLPRKEFILYNIFSFLSLFRK